MRGEGRRERERERERGGEGEGEGEREREGGREGDGNSYTQMHIIYCTCLYTRLCTRCRGKHKHVTYAYTHTF